MLRQAFEPFEQFVHDRECRNDELEPHPPRKVTDHPVFATLRNAQSND